MYRQVQELKSDIYARIIPIKIIKIILKVFERSIEKIRSYF